MKLQGKPFKVEKLNQK